MSYIIIIIIINEVLVRVNAITTLLHQYSVVMQSLKEIGQSNSHVATRARGLYKTLVTGTTAFVQLMSLLILRPMEEINKTLQSRSSRLQQVKCFKLLKLFCMKCEKTDHLQHLMYLWQQLHNTSMIISLRKLKSRERTDRRLDMPIQESCSHTSNDCRSL